MNEIVRLIPMTIQTFDGLNAYAPSQLRPAKDVLLDAFLANYAERPCPLLACIDGRLYSVTAYGSGLEDWYIVDHTGGNDGTEPAIDCNDNDTKPGQARRDIPDNAAHCLADNLVFV